MSDYQFGIPSSDGFQPSELEACLAAVMEDKISKEEFLRSFLQAKLYILLDGPPEGEGLGQRLPMVFAPSAEADRMLAVFTSPMRATAMATRFSEYNHPILVSCPFILSCLGEHIGIALNPGCDLGFEMGAAGVQQLKLALEQA